MPASTTIIPKYDIIISAIKLYHLLVIKKQLLNIEYLVEVCQRLERTVRYYIYSINNSLLELNYGSQIIYKNGYYLCTDEF